MNNATVTQSAQSFKSQGRVFSIKAETQVSHQWINGEPVFTGTEIVTIESTNEEGYAHQLLTAMPLADAVAMAKAILAQAQPADEDAAYDAHIEAMYERHLDHQALVEDAIEHDYEWIRQGC